MVIHYCQGGHIQPIQVGTHPLIELCNFDSDHVWVLVPLQLMKARFVLDELT